MDAEAAVFWDCYLEVKALRHAELEKIALDQLHRFPINTVKIDASFVRNMDVDPKHVEIIQTIVTLAHTLGMDLIAEGVEKTEHVQRLKSFGVEFGQGYLFSKPLDTQTAGDLIAARRQW